MKKYNGSNKLFKAIDDGLEVIINAQEEIKQRKVEVSNSILEEGIKNCVTVEQILTMMINNDVEIYIYNKSQLGSVEIKISSLFDENKKEKLNNKIMKMYNTTLDNVLKSKVIQLRHVGSHGGVSSLLVYIYIN
jgi:hypothetical protein